MLSLRIGDSQLSGQYQLLPQCGTAMGSLHKRVGNMQDDGADDLFLFLDPSRCGPGQADYFVFATNHRRLGYGETRGEDLYAHTHSSALVLAVMIKSKVLKTKISHAQSLILSQYLSLRR